MSTWPELPPELSHVWNDQMVKHLVDQSTIGTLVGFPWKIETTRIAETTGIPNANDLTGVTGMPIVAQ